MKNIFIDFVRVSHVEIMIFRFYSLFAFFNFYFFSDWDQRISEASLLSMLGFIQKLNFYRLKKFEIGIRTKVVGIFFLIYYIFNSNNQIRQELRIFFKLFKRK